MEVFSTAQLIIFLRIFMSTASLMIMISCSNPRVLIPVVEAITNSHTTTTFSSSSNYDESSASAAAANLDTPPAIHYIPMVHDHDHLQQQVEYRSLDVDNYYLKIIKNKSHDDEGLMSWRIFRRRLEPFQLCLNCRCCSAAAAAAGNSSSLCETMPCCFGIDCSLPDKPYGVCAFVPKVCNCTDCANT